MAANLRHPPIIEAHELSKSPNAKVIVLGDKSGLPIILGGQVMRDSVDLVQRIERLERQNRLFKRAATVAALAVIAVVVMGQAAPRTSTVEAQKFVLKDKTGKIRAMLGEGVDNEIGLLIYDGKQRPRAMIAVDDNDLPVIRVSDDAGRERVVLDAISGVRVEGNGPRVVLGVQHGNEPALQLIDKDGWTRATLTLTNTNTAPILKFLDPRGDTRMWLGAMSDGKAQLYMMSRPERGAGVRPSWAALEVAADGTLGLRLNQAGTVWRAP